MSNADETLYNIKQWLRENQHFSNDHVDRVGFLLNEIEYRENQIEVLLKELNHQTSQLPECDIKIKNEYGIDLDD